MADGAPITEVKASTDEEQGEWLLAQDQEAKAAVPDPLVPWQYRLAKYVVNPVTGPATSSIEEAHTLVVKKQVGATLLPLVTAMWFVLALVLIIGQCEYHGFSLPLVFCGNYASSPPLVLSVSSGNTVPDGHYETL